VTPLSVSLERLSPLAENEGILSLDTHAIVASAHVLTHRDEIHTFAAGRRYDRGLWSSAASVGSGSYRCAGPPWTTSRSTHCSVAWTPGARRVLPRPSGSLDRPPLTKTLRSGPLTIATQDLASDITIRDRSGSRHRWLSR